MIRYIQGKLMSTSSRGVVVLVGDRNGIGYEVELPAMTQRVFASKPEGTEVKLFVSFQQSQHQPVPRLYGFQRELERDFFEELLKVSAIGPSVALSAMSSISVPQMARAIVDRDVETLKSLKGIGEKTAEKIIAELRGRAAKYALLPEEVAEVAEVTSDFKLEVRDTLVKQLGFKTTEAQQAIEAALKRNPHISCAEDLFDEVLRGHKHG